MRFTTRPSALAPWLSSGTLWVVLAVFAVVTLAWVAVVVFRRGSSGPTALVAWGLPVVVFVSAVAGSLVLASVRGSGWELADPDGEVASEIERTYGGRLDAVQVGERWLAPEDLERLSGGPLSFLARASWVRDGVVLRVDLPSGPNQSCVLELMGLPGEEGQRAFLICDGAEPVRRM